MRSESWMEGFVLPYTQTDRTHKHTHTHTLLDLFPNIVIGVPPVRVKVLVLDP